MIHANSMRLNSIALTEWFDHIEIDCTGLWVYNKQWKKYIKNELYKAIVRLLHIFSGSMTVFSTVILPLRFHFFRYISDLFEG